MILLTATTLLGVIFHTIARTEGKVTFEKMTNMDYAGSTYYTLRNISLYDCHGTCREETDCMAVVFNFGINPFSPVQESSCQLQNETQAKKPSATAQKSVNTFFLAKIHVRSENVCDRLWSFERVANRMIRGLDNAIIFTSNKEACLAACLNEVRFTCRSTEFNYLSLECHLSEYDRRSPGAFVEMAVAQGVDYFENNCLKPEQVCQDQTRSYNSINVGLPQASVAHFVDLFYYPDKAFLVNSRQECLRQCSLEGEFICRSVLFKSEVQSGRSRCELYHLDSVGYPEGIEIFNNQLPLLDTGESFGFYLESACGNGSSGLHVAASAPRPPLSAVILQQSMTTPNSNLVTDERDPSCDDYGVCYEVSIQCTDQTILVFVKTNKPFHGRVYALGRSETCNASVRNSQQFRLDLSLSGQDCNTQSIGGAYTNTIVLQHHNVVLTKADKVYNVRCTYETTSKNVSFGMMPVRDPDTMQITSSPEAPLPKIVIMGMDGREAATVRIGDKLTFRIEIPPSSPYGIFARSCVAMAKDGRSTFEIIDDRGCPVDSNLFPHFTQTGNALESSYDAFRFTESYGVIFQCNVKYCIGKCDPVTCGASQDRSWGRRRRSQDMKSADEMTLSKEVLVLDFGDDVSRSKSEKPPTANAESFTIRESLSLADDKCASRTSIMALSVTSASLLVIYICTVAYFIAQRRSFKGYQ